MEDNDVGFRLDIFYGLKFGKNIKMTCNREPDICAVYYVLIVRYLISRCTIHPAGEISTRRALRVKRWIGGKKVGEAVLTYVWGWRHLTGRH